MQNKKINYSALKWSLVLSWPVLFLISSVSAQNKQQEAQQVAKYHRVEFSMRNDKNYANPIRDVTLQVLIYKPDGGVLNHFGFYDGGSIWKIRFSPDQPGEWKYEAMFSDQPQKTLSGAFNCIATNLSGRVEKNYYNPFWLGKAEEAKTLFRSFHAGDRFFANNWDDPNNADDGNLRTEFLDWLQSNKYNMLSVGSLFTNRNDKDRGKDWETPKLWPIDPAEYQKMEIILDDLEKRDIVVFPFAGFFGLNGEWPTAWDDQQLYIRYILARIGHYPNIIFNIAGPEPFWAEYGYKNSMRSADIKRLGILIDSLDVQQHTITVHNEKRATQYGDPFIDEPWCDLSTLQGPTTINRETLYSGLIMNHRKNKPAYAQETMWAGNVWHPKYSFDQIRKNTYTILFSGSILNFADNNGNSSTGFSGTMDLAQVNQSKHDVVRKVSDWFESIPFNQMTVRQDVVRAGFCLANEGVEYYVYLDTIGKIDFFLDYPYNFRSEWINAKDPEDKRLGPVVSKNTIFESPTDGDDWILHVYAGKPESIAIGNFPDLAVDSSGDIHVVYNRAGLKYKRYSSNAGKWTNEYNVGCDCENINRSEPDIVVDSKGNPHVFCGKEYAYFDGKAWHKSIPGGTRDTELAIDANDRVYLISRGGNNGGYIGLTSKSRANEKWLALNDPDKKNKGHNDHVYPDIFIGLDGQIHVVQRHGPSVEVTYRKSMDGGSTWRIEEPVSNERSESPHIVVDRAGNVIIATGNGSVFERIGEKWKFIGRKLQSFSRIQPEWAIDGQDDLYLTCFGGQYNTRHKSVWMGERIIDPITIGKQIGFVETAGHENFSYIIWEEGRGNADEGLEDDAQLVVGILYPDGRVVGLD